MEKSSATARAAWLLAALIIYPVGLCTYIHSYTWKNNDLGAFSRTFSYRYSETMNVKISVAMKNMELSKEDSMETRYYLWHR